MASSTGAGNTTTTATGTANQLWVPVVKIEAFSNLTVVGSVVGGGGGGQYSTTPNGLSGGSGGGGAYGSGVAATGTAGQGNSGGFGGTCGGSGGGGAGGAGVNCSGTNGGNGGLGVASSITGASVFYAAGGAGGAYTGNGGTGGSGIGGNGGNYSPATACTSAAANTGSGGGGVSSTGPCAGGSGIVIVSYPSGIPVTGPPPTCTANTDGPGGAFSNVMALYHFDGNFNDSSGRGHTGTAVGGQTTSTAQFKFGSASLLGAVNKTVTVPVSNDFIFTGDFTFEYWAYLTAPTSASQSPVWANYNSAGGGWSMGVDISAPNTNSPNFYYGPTAASVTWSATTVGNAWRHWAFVRSGTTLNLYIDGTAVSPAKSVSGNVGDATYTISIGAGNTAGSPYYLGYLDEIRVSNIARYVANFTPPTLPFCNN